jgi:hypothetical protein
MDDFDLDLDEVLETTDSYKSSQRNDDRTICSCGHGIARHKFNPINNSHTCMPGRLSCPCLVPTPVMDTPNTRYFMRKSHGSGSKHALSMGYAASKEALGEEFSEKIRWLIDPKCQFCGNETKYYPVRVTSTGTIVLDSDPKDPGVTAFLCTDCRDPRKQTLTIERN